MDSSDALRLGFGVAIATAIVGMGTPALADEPRKVSEPAILSEPAEITQVVDAFDDTDPFDLNLTLGYQQTWSSATIRRETFIAQPGLSGGGFINDTMNIGTYSQSTSRLNTRADIGIYKNVALVLRMPIILSDDRKIEGVDGSDKRQSVVLEGAPGEQLFRLPFNSPTRSGIEYFAVGLDVGVMDQYRDRTKPTWVIGVEGRFDVSEPMHACNASPKPLNQPGKQVDCAYPSDINRNGVSGESIYNTPNASNLEGTFSGARKPGVSRGTTGLEAHTFLSKRIKYIEPYGGFRALFEFQSNSSDYGGTSLKGSLVNHPPLRGSIIMGMSVIPWEVRDQFQRITFDFRLTGTYVSEGRDYSELFDALGSSDAPSIRSANFAEYQANPDAGTQGQTPSVVNPNSQKVYFTGLTDVQQHGVYNLSAQFTWQAGEYVKFNLGGGYTLVQSHFISFDQACNPEFNGSLQKAGSCKSISGTRQRATGIPNPNYRAAINVPGRRFKVDDSHAFDAWLNATVMF